MNEIPDKLLITDDFTDYFGDTVMMDWIERHLLTISLSVSGKQEITYTENGRAKSVVGDSVRHAVAGLLWYQLNGNESISPIALQKRLIGIATAAVVAEASDPIHRERWLKMMADRNWRIERDDAGEVTALQHRPTGTRIEGTAVTRWLVMDAEPPTGDTWEDVTAFAMETYRPLWEKLAALDEAE